MVRVKRFIGKDAWPRIILEFRLEFTDSFLWQVLRIEKVFKSLSAYYIVKILVIFSVLIFSSLIGNVIKCV